MGLGLGLGLGLEQGLVATAYTSMVRSCPPHASSPPAYSPLPGANLTSSSALVRVLGFGLGC